MLDPFSGRAMIPLEAARLGVAAYGIDLPYLLLGLNQGVASMWRAVRQGCLHC